MVCVDWHGPLPLTYKTAAGVCSYSPAVALLGSRDSHGIFIIKRLIRSDADIRAYLQRFIGQYSFCKVAICQTPAEAFMLECEIYHRMRPSDCSGHPSKPDGLNVVCPFCGFRIAPQEVA